MYSFYTFDFANESTRKKKKKKMKNHSTIFGFVRQYCTTLNNFDFSDRIFSILVHTVFNEFLCLVSTLVFQFNTKKRFETNSSDVSGSSPNITQVLGLTNE